MVRGIQSEGVGACLKHYVANNHESYRMVCDVIVDERTLRELYLRGFEIAVTESAPWAVMTSYNLVNGEYVGDSERLVNGILRTEWGFDGLVVTDWGGMNDRVAATRAGVDLEMPSSGGAHDRPVIEATEAGELHPEVLLDRVVAVSELATRRHCRSRPTRSRRRRRRRPSPPCPRCCRRRHGAAREQRRSPPRRQH